MIERVARAICQMSGGWPDTLGGDGLRGWQHWIKEAEAAIKAMHEPTEGMVRAGNASGLKATVKTVSADVWQAMIDKALEDG